jgi:PAS domain S-box-containing protein
LNYRGKNGSLSFARDITERKTMERERLRYTERLEALLQNIPVMIAYPDEQGSYQWVNNAWETTYGWSMEEARKMNIKEQIPDEAERRRVIDFIREDVNTGKWQDFKNRRRDGKDIVTTWSNISLSDGSMIGIGMDITDRKRMENELQSSLEKLRKAVMGIIGVTANVVEKRDPYTAGHERRVAEISRAIAREMNLPSDEIEGIYLAASIHDIGKIAIPAEILSKPGRLLEIEYMLIQTHAQAGYDILKDIDFPWSLADMVVQHHERYNGKGYPKGLKGDDIQLGARIMAVADVVESMANHRPYRPALGIDMAMEEIEKNRNIFYDGEVVDACLRLFKEQKFQLSN